MFRSLAISFWTLIGGTLIDLDHLYDYARHGERPSRGKWDLSHFFAVICGCKLTRVYVLLHSWELVAVLLVLGWCIPGAGTILVPLSFGMAVHLLFDAFANPATVLSYSLVGRAVNRFSAGYFFRR